MCNFQCDHCSESLEAARNKFGGIGDKMAVQAEDSTDIPAIVFHEVHKSAKHWYVCEELYLSRTVHEQIVIVSKALQARSLWGPHFLVHTCAAGLASGTPNMRMLPTSKVEAR
jgi:uncharacterized protein YjaZ